MFKEKFEKLCVEKKVFPTIVCTAIGLSKSAYTKWSDESMPRKTTLLKLAEYFGVPVEYFTTDEPEEIKMISPNKQALLNLINTLSEEQIKKLAELIESMK